MEIKLYSTGCPKCTILQKKLDNKNIEYTKITEVEIMKELGIIQVPVLEVNGTLYNFKEANTWVEEYNGN